MWRDHSIIPDVTAAVHLISFEHFMVAIGSMGPGNKKIGVFEPVNLWTMYNVELEERHLSCKVRYGNQQVLQVGGLIMSSEGYKFPVEIASVNVINMTVGVFEIELPEFRMMHACQFLNVGGQDMTIIAGGYDSTGIEQLASVIGLVEGASGPEIVDLGQMNLARNSFSIGVIGGHLAAFGGEPLIRTRQSEVYDADSNTWNYTSIFINSVGRDIGALVNIPCDFDQVNGCGCEADSSPPPSQSTWSSTTVTTQTEPVYTKPALYEPVYTKPALYEPVYTKPALYEPNEETNYLE